MSVTLPVIPKVLLLNHQLAITIIFLLGVNESKQMPVMPLEAQASSYSCYADGIIKYLTLFPQRAMSQIFLCK